MITWKIESMSVKPQEGSYTDVVVIAAWRCSGSSGEFIASNYGSVSFVGPGDDFVPYQDLTEDEVLGWVWANGVDKDEVEANVTRELDMLVNPPIVSLPLPWSAE
jgi:hypothetical protein